MWVFIQDTGADGVLAKSSTKTRVRERSGTEITAADRNAKPDITTKLTDGLRSPEYHDVA
jgi:hypothetical protein